MPHSNNPAKNNDSPAKELNESVAVKP